MSDNVQLFEEQPIRTAWDEESQEWYFSVVDVVRVLTESKDPAAYWRKLKQRLKAEGNETVTNCHALKMTAADGRKRLTDVADTPQLLRLIQSIPSPKAEPFKLWLAQESELGHTVISAQNAAQLNEVVTGVIEGIAEEVDGDTAKIEVQSSASNKEGEA